MWQCTTRWGELLIRRKTHICKANWSNLHAGVANSESDLRCERRRLVRNQLYITPIGNSMRRESKCTHHWRRCLTQDSRHSCVALPSIPARNGALDEDCRCQLYIMKPPLENETSRIRTLPQLYHFLQLDKYQEIPSITRPLKINGLGSILPYNFHLDWPTHPQ